MIATLKHYYAQWVIVRCKRKNLINQSRHVDLKQLHQQELTTAYYTSASMPMLLHSKYIEHKGQKRYMYESNSGLWCYRPFLLLFCILYILHIKNTNCYIRNVYKLGSICYLCHAHENKNNRVVPRGKPLLCSMWYSVRANI